MQTRFRPRDFDWARALADVLLDAVRGPRRTAASSSRATITSGSIHRTKPGPDNATPSGNGVAARALIALGHLAAEPRYVEAGERAVRLFAAALAQSPGGYSTLLGAAGGRAGAADLGGARPAIAAQCAAWQRALERAYRPGVRIDVLQSSAGDLQGDLRARALGLPGTSACRHEATARGRRGVGAACRGGCPAGSRHGAAMKLACIER